MVEIVPPASVPRPRLGELCVAIQASTPAEMWPRAATAAVDAKFLELRLDTLPKPLAAIPGLQEFLASHRDCPP